MVNAVNMFAKVRNRETRKMNENFIKSQMSFQQKKNPSKRIDSVD